MKNPSRTWTICSGCTSFLIVNQDYPSSLRTTTPAGVYRAQPPKAALSAEQCALPRKVSQSNVVTAPAGRLAFPSREGGTREACDG